MGKNLYSIRALTFGVSFNHMFKLLDFWGEIADDLLYNNKYFSTVFFPEISSNYTTERRLSNSDKGHLFLLSSNNLIFTQASINDFEKDFKDFKEKISEYIIPAILSRYGLVIRRLGTVYVCEMDDLRLKEYTDMFFKPSIQNVVDFRFSRTEPTIKGEMLKNNADFVNKIYTLGNVLKDTRGISYDYQYHFYPLRADVRDFGEKFINQSFSNFQTDIVDIRMG